MASGGGGDDLAVKRFGLLDGYILRLTLWPLAGALAVTLVALLLERVLRLLDAL